eukprot:TRINITY_DN36123_c0_g1_i1.p1 TRINITY_DN36123_c0_g1~~TRINITY_DN36123_c0_g1_i1.p1  ORF type:complete len:853 (+),score=191.26 TRINITY_DN36123_c0_g1_i1:133-2559(+)
MQLQNAAAAAQAATPEKLSPRGMYSLPNKRQDSATGTRAAVQLLNEAPHGLSWQGIHEEFAARISSLRIDGSSSPPPLGDARRSPPLSPRSRGPGAELSFDTPPQSGRGSPRPLVAYDRLDAVVKDLRKEMKASEQRLDQKVQSIAAFLTSLENMVVSSERHASKPEIAKLQMRVSVLEEELPLGSLKAASAMVSADARRLDDLSVRIDAECEARCRLVSSLSEETEKRFQESDARLIESMREQQNILCQVIEERTRDMLAEYADQHTKQTAGTLAALEDRATVMLATQVGQSERLAADRFEGHAQEVTELRARLEHLERHLTQQLDLTQQLESHKEKLEKFVELAAAEARAAVDSLRKEVPWELKRFGAEVADKLNETWGATIEETSRSLATAKQDMKDIAAELAALREQLGNRSDSKEFTKINILRSTLSEEIAALREQLGRISDSKEFTRDQINILRNTLGDELAALREQLDRISDSKEFTVDKIDFLRAEQNGSSAGSTISQELADIRAEVRGIADSKQDIMLHIDNLRSNIGAELADVTDHVNSEQIAALRAEIGFIRDQCNGFARREFASRQMGDVQGNVAVELAVELASVEKKAEQALRGIEHVRSDVASNAASLVKLQQDLQKDIKTAVNGSAAKLASDEEEKMIREVRALKQLLMDQASELWASVEVLQGKCCPDGLQQSIPQTVPLRSPVESGSEFSAQEKLKDPGWAGSGTYLIRTSPSLQSPQEPSMVPPLVPSRSPRTTGTLGSRTRDAPLDPSSHAEQREDLLWRLQEAEELLQRQQNAVQRSKRQLSRPRTGT